MLELMLAGDDDDTGDDVMHEHCGLTRVVWDLL